MNEEEKEAIDKLKRSANYFVMPIYETTIILNLIENQQKEIKELKEKEKNLLEQLKDSEKELLEVTQNVVSKDKIREKNKRV